MGRQRKPYKLRQRTPGGVIYARLYLPGQPELSTGIRPTRPGDFRAAEPEADRLYAAEVLKASQRSKRKRARAGAHSATALRELIARWLVSLESTHAENTRKTWELYAFTHWEPHFSSAYNLTREQIGEYMRARLKKVVAETVKKELTALRSFLNWCVSEGEIPPPDEGAVFVPPLPDRATGTPHPVKRRSAAVPLDPEHVEAFLAALPEWSTSKKVDSFAVRARFVVAYETSLRPSTLDRLDAPKHYRPGEGVIRLTSDTDKVRWARDIPLSDRARAALDAVLAGLTDQARERGELATDADYSGPIFGAHDYSAHVERAAQTLPPEVRDRFCGAHLRSAALTHWIDDGVPLTAAQWMAGQKRVSTTARYVKSSFRSARDAVTRRASDDEPKS
jgi:site-specific recombinase XerD